METKPRVAVHKFSSCDGCQLAFLNLGAELIQLSHLVDIVHFAEAGPVAPDASVDIAFVEGSIATPEDEQRIRHVRDKSRYLVAIGACATAGGLQALRNQADGAQWLADIYPKPDLVAFLPTSTPLSAHVSVDFALWGCPVNSRQILKAVRALLFGVDPVADKDKVCLTCKQEHVVCVLVAKGQPCMGPVTQTGCGALCPAFARACYGCYGPAENPNTEAFTRRLTALGLSREASRQRFLAMNAEAPVFAQAGRGGSSDDTT